MRISEEKIKSSDERTMLSCRLWEPEDMKPKAALQIIHGMSEHISRYDEFAGFLCDRGFAVFGDDHLGHGDTVRNCGGIPGYFSEKDGDSLLVEDAHRVNLYLRDRFPCVPCAILGHSMGSFILRAYLAHYRDADAAVIMGTSGACLPYGAAVALASCIAAMKGSGYRSSLLKKLSVGSYNRAFETPGCSGWEWLTRDDEVVRAYVEDEMCGFDFTAAGYRDLFRLLGTVQRRAWSKCVPHDIPILLVSGALDPVGENGRGVERVASRLRCAGCKDVSVTLYEGCRHEILNETCRGEVFEDIFVFLKEAVKI